MLQIKIKYLSDAIDKIQKISIGDWIDLRAAQEVVLKKGEQCYIPLGVAMELPKGYEAWLTSRSSMAKKFNIQHSDDLGVLDNSTAETAMSGNCLWWLWKTLLSM